MTMWLVPLDGKLVSMPFDFDWIVPSLEGKLPNKVILTMDEARFQRGLIDHAIWTHGHSQYASLACCAGELTIQRYETLKEAIRAKQTIDNSGCGGGCCRVHLIVRADARQEANVREHAEKQMTNAPK